MILIDTHIWVWWANDAEHLSDSARRHITSESEIALSVMSCWEVAKAVERRGLRLDGDVEDWIYAALSEPRISLVPITPRIAVESTRLPQPFHRDPADQLIVATARVLDVALLSADRRIRDYRHVRSLKRDL